MHVGLVICISDLHAGALMGAAMFMLYLRLLSRLDIDSTVVAGISWRILLRSNILYLK